MLFGIESQDILFFGGYKHEPNIPAAIKLVKEIFPLIKSKVSKARIILAGSHAPQEIIDLGKIEGVVYKGFIEEDELFNLYKKSKCTVIPLLSGAGIKGKICEAIVHKVPIVTNKIGNEGINLEHEKDGFICESIEEFAKSTIKVLNNDFDLKLITENAQNRLDSIVGSQVNTQRIIKSITPCITICIVTWNRINLLKRCISSVLKNTIYSNYKILIYSNGCSDGTSEYLQTLKKEHKEVEIILSKTNDVFVKPNNVMMNYYQDNDVVLLNNDTYVTSGWLNELFKAAYSDSKIGISGSKILYPNGKLQEFGAEIFPNYTGNNIGKNDNPSKQEYNSVQKRGYVSGCSMFIKRSTINKIGVFDERFHPCYCEDSDYCYTAWEKGIETIVVPSSIIYHDEGGTSGTDTSSGFKTFQDINFIKFNQKHQGKINNINWFGDSITSDDIINSAKINYKDPFGQKLLNGTQKDGSIFNIEKIESFKSRLDFILFRELYNDVIKKRRDVEKIIFHYIQNKRYLKGYSAEFKKDAKYLITEQTSRILNLDGVKIPELKESLYDYDNGLNARERLIIKFIIKYISTKGVIINTFYKSKFSNVLKKYFTNTKNVIDNNLYQDNKKSKSFLGQLKQLKNYDCVIFTENLQLYQNPFEILDTAYNNLNEGGIIICTLPFLLEQENGFQRVVIEKNDIKYIADPIYYPNNINSDKPLLCHNQFSWDILDRYPNSSMNHYWSLREGFLGSNNIVFIIQK